MQLVPFNKISPNSIDESSGVYAWYYRVSLGDHDIKKLTHEISLVEEHEKIRLVESFLDRHVYQYFRESNYVASIHGKLMPEFKGELLHVSQSSKSLAADIAEEPQILWGIKSTLSSISIEFSSPIYIGMADNLRTRLLKHKGLIESFKNKSFVNEEQEDRDSNFALRVVSREMLTKNLVVSVKYIDSADRLHRPIENLMK